MAQQFLLQLNSLTLHLVLFISSFSLGYVFFFFCLVYFWLPVSFLCGNQKMLDFSGIDTTGGVRIPASFCGILGFRPSQGTVSSIGVLPNSQSLETVGTLHSVPPFL